MEILAFESWDSGSHQAFRTSLTKCSRHQWQWLTLPRGHWRIRLRLSAIELAKKHQGEKPDVIFATSLLSLSDLIALLPGSLADIPRVLYMHEHQGAYPHAEGREEPRDAHALVTNLMSILAADCVLWNSAWAKESFLEAVKPLIRMAHIPKDALGQIESRSHIAWPPVEVPMRGSPEILHKAEAAKDRGLTLVAWPHRWEHDKGPMELLDIDRTYGQKHHLGWVLLGEQFQEIPEEMNKLLAEAGDRVIHHGWAERNEYETWLHACDWVLSTATHEYFGMGVVEAMLAGCLPWLPDRLSYPELVPTEDQGITPWRKPPDKAMALSRIKTHLRAATAMEASAHIDSLIYKTTRQNRP